jgi:hypothetical protein
MSKMTISMVVVVMMISTATRVTTACLAVMVWMKSTLERAMIGYAATQVMATFSMAAPVLAENWHAMS